MNPDSNSYFNGIQTRTLHCAMRSILNWIGSNWIESNRIRFFDQLGWFTGHSNQSFLDCIQVWLAVLHDQTRRFDLRDINWIWIVSARWQIFQWACFFHLLIYSQRIELDTFNDWCFFQNTSRTSRTWKSKTWEVNERHLKWNSTSRAMKLQLVKRICFVE